MVTDPAGRSTRGHQRSELIAHIVHWPKSGVGTLVRQLTQHDQSGRYRYIVIFLETDAASIDQYSSSQVTVMGLSVGRNPLSALLKIRRCLRGVDVVHTHSFLPHLLATLARPGTKRHIRTIHNPYPYFTAPDLRSKLKRYLEGLLISISRADLVSVSMDVRRSLPWQPRPGSRSTVIDNGLDLRQIQREGSLPCDIPKPPGLLFVALGRLERQKGFDVLLDAMALLRSRLGDRQDPVHLWIIGDGGERGNLEQQATRLQLSNVQFLGYRTQPYRYLSRGDLFVLPSRFEGFGLAAIEALALRVPIILTDSGGIASTLTHGDNAHIVPKEDSEALTQALLTLADRPDYRERLAASGKAFVDSTYSIDLCADRYAEMYGLGQLNG